MTKSQSVRRIMIVDDEPDICDCLEQFFRSRGFAVQSAFSGEEAIEQFEQRPADVILLDIRLPGISGLEVLKRVKDLNPEARVIIITSLDSPETKIEAQTYGACAYITKPFDFSDLTWASVLSPVD